MPLYGVQFFHVKEESADRILGIAEDGVLISQKKQNQEERPSYHFYPFEEIGGWEQIPQGIQINITHPDKVFKREIYYFFKRKQFF